MPFKNLKLTRGFSLIELLVVMSVMAVLASAIVMATNNARDKGKDARRKQDLQGISSALVAYYVDHHEYPKVSTSYTQLDYPSSVANPWIPYLTDYIPKLPKDPLQTTSAALSNFFAKAFGGLRNIAGNFNKPSAPSKQGQVAQASSVNFGNTNPESTGDTSNSIFNGSKFPTGASGGQATSMSIYITDLDPVTTNRKFVLAIYSDIAGKPGTLIANTDPTSTLTLSNNWNSSNLTTNPTLMPNTTYWLMFNTNGNSGIKNRIGTMGDGYFFAYTYNTTTPAPNPPPTGAGTGAEQGTYSIYATYTPNNNIYSATVSTGADDGKTLESTINNTHITESSIVDNPQGTYYGCTPNQDKRDNYFRFSNISIPKDSTINSAYLTITPSPYGGSPAQNSVDILDFISDLKADQDDNSAAFPVSTDPPGFQSSITNYYNRLIGNTVRVPWDNIDKWQPLAPGANVSPNIRDIIQPLVNRGTWTGSPTHITILWVDRGTTPGCTGSPTTGQGRAGVSYEGQVAGHGEAPRLTITWTPLAASTPAPSATPAGWNGGGAGLNGQCDSKNNIYCYRTNAAGRVFVLWTQLENANDQELSTNANAKCRENDPDFDATNPLNTSPFKGLGKPTSSGLNYCIKSPPL